MKNYKTVFTLCLLLQYFSGLAQFVTRPENGEVVNYKNIEVGFSKTTSIVFPYPIKSVDKGSADILVQKAKNVENILLVKASVPSFKQTNLTVVTTDGSLYGFIISYDDLCPVLNVITQKEDAADKEILFSSEIENQKKIEKSARLALSKKKKISGLSKRKYAIKLSVSGIFIEHDVLYFRLVLGNKSQMSYAIDQLRFFIRDQKKAARTASQEIEILPFYVTAEPQKIMDQSEISIVFAFSKFSIPQNQFLAVQLIEKEGGRHLQLNIKNRALLKVDKLTSF